MKSMRQDWLNCRRVDIMTDIEDLCSKIEHTLTGFELCNDLRIDDIHIVRYENGQIKSVRVQASGEYTVST